MYHFHLKGRKSAEQETRESRHFIYGLYGAISQKMPNFITTAVRTSNPKYKINSPTAPGFENTVFVVVTTPPDGETVLSVSLSLYGLSPRCGISAPSINKN
jgi:hypothetical protein